MRSEAEFETLSLRIHDSIGVAQRLKLDHRRPVSAMTEPEAHPTRPAGSTPPDTRLSPPRTTADSTELDHAAYTSGDRSGHRRGTRSSSTSSSSPDLVADELMGAVTEEDDEPRVDVRRLWRLPRISTPARASPRSPASPASPAHQVPPVVCRPVAQPSLDLAQFARAVLSHEGYDEDTSREFRASMQGKHQVVVADVRWPEELENLSLGQGRVGGVPPPSAPEGRDPLPVHHLPDGLGLPRSGHLKSGDSLRGQRGHRRARSRGRVGRGARTTARSPAPTSIPDSPPTPFEDDAFYARTPSKKLKQGSCFCGKPDGDDPMIECSKCLEWFHFKCVHLTRRSKIPDVWECPPCHRQCHAPLPEEDASLGPPPRKSSRASTEASPTDCSSSSSGGDAHGRASSGDESPGGSLEDIANHGLQGIQKLMVNPGIDLRV